MDLNKYNEKRDFDLTTEPQGVLKKAETELIFVVQKHAASHLYCDFWLERDGDFRIDFSRNGKTLLSFYFIAI